MCREDKARVMFIIELAVVEKNQLLIKRTFPQKRNFVVEIMTSSVINRIRYHVFLTLK